MLNKVETVTVPSSSASSYLPKKLSNDTRKVYQKNKMSFEIRIVKKTLDKATFQVLARILFENT